MGQTRFSGSMTALITPMKKDGSVDKKAFESLMDWQIQEGTSALVPVGTTGESPTLTHQEHRDVVEMAVKVAAGRVPIIAGAGSNSTAEAVEMARHAQKAGADAVLVVTPYYNKPTQEGLYLHFSSVADNIDLPLFIYNIPGRSVIDLSVPTLARLAQHRNIVGVKDATANLLRPLQVKQAVGNDFIQLSGEDGTAVSFLAAGGVGCISVTANIVPALCARIQQLWKAGQTQEAIHLQDRLFPLHDALFCESNPAPVKYAASLIGKSTAHCRLPLAPLSVESKKKVEEALHKVGGIL